MNGANASRIIRYRKNHTYDKQIFNINTTTTNSATSQSLITLTYPCVAMGIVVSGGSISETDSVPSAVQWFLVKLEEGQVVDTISFNAASYQPEQAVLCFGAGPVNINSPLSFMVKTKTGRKMKAGDQVVFVISSTVAAKVIRHCYTVQYFLKIS